MKNTNFNLSLFLICMCAFIMPACMSTQVTSTAGQTFAPTTPNEVVLFLDKENEVERDHFEIGRITIDQGAIENSKPKIYEALKTKAASIGGQGVTKIAYSGRMVTAIVIRFER